ncbi:DUF1552 domain-containing protein [Stratiformator vulcanicus]|uniref:Secreted protein containing DUF1552 n=1 Tax=Stratiformator vulcanicus TaxID=2527980 RepID=A0A517R7Q9_9PLAN|nr:DUF1552 domain-containing protein [Stratiformator vulcanicus]QDT39929.1 hypothetical protein Pan189_43410 [Stratiformator vulcanicus]
MSRFHLDRRTFLRGTGIALALPMLESMRVGGTARAADAADVPKRMLCMNFPLGIHRNFLYPKKTGTDFESTPYLEPLDEFRGQFSIFGGMQHPDVDGGHSATASFLTAAPHPGGSSFKNTISVDQYAAEQIGHLTRYGSLTLSIKGNGGLSWSRDGVMIPADDSPSKVFQRLFMEGSKQEQAQQVARLRDGQSIMDLVRDQAKRVEGKLGKRDKETLDQYFTAVRDLEGRLVKGEDWAKRPKPKVDVKKPNDISDKADFVGRTRLMYDMIYLALQTDSTRLVTVQMAGDASVPPIDGVDEGWHPLSHHGRDPDKLEQLKKIEVEEFKEIANLMGRLRDSNEGDESILDRTSILFGSNLGDANSHHNRNLPIIVAGGGFKHQGHVGYDQAKAPPVCNAFVSMLQNLGLETDEFASSTGTLTELG